MSKGDEVGSLVNRIASWAVIIPLALYVLNLGAWVGAAEEQHKSAKKVEEQVDDVKTRLTTLETEVKNLSINSKASAAAIIKAIEKLEKKIEDK